MNPGPLLTLLALSCVRGPVVSGRELVYVTVLFRHGDRSPIRAYPTDPYQESAWPQGFGQLSQVGMKQHYNLGQFLRKRYTGFLKESYDRQEISVRSTDFDRTLMSAEANLAGLYPPNGSQVFNPDIKWQPIPVHTVPMPEERLLSFPLSDCPRYKQLMSETEQTPEFRNVTAFYQDVIELVRNKTLLNKTNIESVWGVYDTLFCEAQHNMTPPDWVTPDVMTSLKYLKDFAFRMAFGIYKQTEKSRLQGGLLLGEIVKNLTLMATENPKPKLKLMMLSAHDTTVAALQASLNVFNGIQPPYASCHIFELNKEENGAYTVSMFYRNNTELYPVELPGCALDCPLEDFRALTKPSISDDRDQECQLPSPGTSKEVIISLAVSGCVLFILIATLLAVICRQTEPMRSRGYQHVINEAES
ncbi:lysosomal acid phosphatase [Periophthalmus magnuspinnatus]|uniref:lysosomal acid phosphatase n=1 Tax=Periophthalmus magnuspinnatus TaxID=409849 RepID=UPI00145B4E15|nr:lysosomal acid phosphatase [Periophthalmus magnuspinnatus]